MTNLLYQTDSYLKTCEATILEVTEKGVVLDRTVFYPGGGGQPTDYGQIIDANGVNFNVNGVKRIDGKIVHLIDWSAGLEKGVKITAEIVGLDLQADGGTHVANTREVGNLHIADYKSKGRINKRLVVALEG